MRLYAARHGESEANVLRIISNRDAALGLTALGVEQAEGLAAALRQRGVRRIFASPVLRASQTAEIVARRLRIPWETAIALREFDCGEAEGRSDPVAWGMHTAVVKAWLDDGCHDARISGGESFNDMRQRFVPFVRKLVAETKDLPVLLISHGAVLQCMLPLVLANVDHRFATEHPLSPAGHVGASLADGRLRCFRWDGVAVDRLPCR